jgi:hypothetical protein
MPDFEKVALYTIIRYLRSCGYRVYRGSDFHKQIRYAAIIVGDWDQMEIAVYCPLDAYQIWHAGVLLGSIDLNDPCANEKVVVAIEEYLEDSRGESLFSGIGQR